MSSKSSLLVAKGVLFCYVNEYMLKPWKLRNDMISSNIKAILNTVIAIQQKEFFKSMYMCIHALICSLGMHIAINMIHVKEMHLF